MTEAVQEIEIEAPQVAGQTVPPVQEDDEATKALREQLEAARKTATAEAERRAAAERARKEEEDRVKDLEEQYKVERQSSIIGSLEAATAERDHAKAAYADALKAGDYARAAEEQEKLSSAVWKIRALEEKKSAAPEAAAHSKTTEGRVRSPEPSSQADPVETYLSQFSPRTQSYLRQRPDIVSNAKLNKKAAWLHDEAIEKGLKPDSDEYFSFLDDKLGYSAPAPRPKAGDVNGATVPAKKAPTATAAAPPSRSTFTPAGNGKVRVSLTEGQKRAARIAGVSEEDYAKQLLIADQSGLLSK